MKMFWPETVEVTLSDGAISTWLLPLSPLKTTWPDGCVAKAGVLDAEPEKR